MAMSKAEYDNEQIKRKAKALRRETGMKYTEARRKVEAEYVSNYVSYTESLPDHTPKF